jgi:hypothetical protein
MAAGEIVGLGAFEVAVVVAGFAYLERGRRALSEQMKADDAALFLQGRRVAEVLREMRESLQR